MGFVNDNVGEIDPVILAGIHWLVVFKHTVNPLTSYIKSC